MIIPQWRSRPERIWQDKLGRLAKISIEMQYSDARSYLNKDGECLAGIVLCYGLCQVRCVGRASQQAHAFHDALVG